MRKGRKNWILAVPLVLLLTGGALLLRVRAGQAREAPALPATGAADPAQSMGEDPARAEETPAPMEPKTFVLSAIGDCTLQSGPNFLESSVGYKATMNGDYAYPFSHTAQYFAEDDFTLANLECNFSDEKLSPSYMATLEGFYFLCPTDWLNILTEGGVDFVTTANNHLVNDFDQRGREDTYAALEEHGIAYGKEGQAQIVTTQSGLALGIYCDYNGLHPKAEAAVSAIADLKAQGAEYIICMFHWGKEIHYSPTEDDQETARACIDAGAHLVYGSHSHCLQPIEEYNGGLILYSMGNWSFGGSTMPTDPDTAIVQITVNRDANGVASNGGFTVVPCSVSSKPYKKNTNYNDYCPTPYEEGSSEYGRVLSKLDGSFEPDHEGADYSNYNSSWGRT